MAFREDQEWVLVDFKTDAAAEARCPYSSHYRGQLLRYVSFWWDAIGELVADALMLFTAGIHAVSVRR